MNWDELYRNIINVNLFLILIFGLFFNILFEPKFTFGFLSGAILAFGNFHMLQRSIKKLFKNGTFTGKKETVLLRFYFRLAILGIIVYILLGKDVNPVGIVTGVFCTVSGIMLTAIYCEMKNKKRR